MKKIVIATGTRADWGLLYPLVKRFTDMGNRPSIIATYAHLFLELGDTIQELVTDGFPPTMSVPARMKGTEAVADTVVGFSKAFSFLKPDIVVILGDRFEMLGVATAAVFEGIPIAHIAGGTVSKGAIDDVFRNAISQMATLHFPETKRGRRKLIMNGAEPENIVIAGALGVFNALNTTLLTREELEESISFRLGERYVLATYHPATLDTLSPSMQMSVWIDGLQKFIDNHDDINILLTFPNSDTDPTALLSMLYGFELRNRERIKIVESLGRVRYLSAARGAAAVAGNSSSGIVEIPSLGVPVVDVGVRQEGRERSKAVLHCELDADAIETTLGSAVSPEYRDMIRGIMNPYYRNDTPGIIAEKILSFLSKK